MIASKAQPQSSDGGTRTDHARDSGVTLIDVLPQHRFDEWALWKYLAAHLENFPVSATLKQFQGGQSNPTFLIETSAQKYVLRKKPPGKLLPSAHLIEREYRLLRAMPRDQVPVPHVRLLCEDASVIGTPFYVMDHIEGRIMTAAALPQVDVADRRAIYRDLARVCANLHRVDYRACGLADFGKPHAYVARQLDRWTKQYAAAKTDENPDMDWLIAWLNAGIPAGDETAIAHGDFRIGNTIIHHAEPRIIAVLDWELATLGHPLSDLAYACMNYHIPARHDALGGLLGLDLKALGILEESDFLEVYCRQAGRGEIPDWGFFLAFAFFRLASITQGVYARALQGNAADQRAFTYGELSRELAAIGCRIAAGAG